MPASKRRIKPMTAAMKTGLSKAYVSLIIAEHEAWLKAFPDHLAAWHNRLRENEESAIAEAVVRRLLVPQVSKIEPHEMPGQGGFDFVCRPNVDLNAEFFVEVTNLGTKALITHTCLSESIDGYADQTFTSGSIAKFVRGRRQKKQDQIKHQGPGGPVLIVLTAFHRTASFVHFSESGVVDLLRPPTIRRMPIGGGESWEEPVFEDSVFFRPGTCPHPYRSACPEVSAVALCAIPWLDEETRDTPTYVAMNPNASYPIDPKWIPSWPCYCLDGDWKNQDPCHWRVKRQTI
jgi:hypothetical protein